MVEIDQVLEASTLLEEHIGIAEISIEGFDEYVLALGKPIFVQKLSSDQIGLARFWA
jgi:hypothetical protein